MINFEEEALIDPASAAHDIHQINAQLARVDKVIAVCRQELGIGGVK